MRIILTTTLLVALLCFFSPPISTVGLPKEPWRKPLKLAAGHHGDSKVRWASSSLLESNAPLSPPGLLRGFPNIPGLPNIPGIPIIPGLPSIPQIPNMPRIPSIPQLPNIPGLPNIPSLPNLPGLPSLPGLPRLPQLPPLPPVRSQVVSQSAEVEKCLRTDRSKTSKTSKKCFSQISSSWSRKDFALLDNDCCEIVVKLGKKCKSHIHMLFKSPFFVPLLRYSCHIKHTKY